MIPQLQEPKEPWRAVFLSSFLPGLGELSMGRPGRGALFILLFALLVCGLLSRLSALIYIPETTLNFKEAMLLLSLMVGAAALSLISFIDGYALAKRYNKRHGLQIPPDRKKAPWLSAVLSRFIPGLGQLYNGDILKALLHAVAWCVVVWFLRASWLLVGAGVLAVLSMIDAYDGAVTINGGGDAFHRRCRPWGIALATVWILMCYLPPPLIAQSCLFQVYRIPGGAMQPCLRANDRVIVDTILFRLRGVRRGDVLLFKAPDRPGRCYTKRVVGMPGETIEIRGGKVVINVKPLEAGGIIDRIAYSNYGTFCRPGQVLRIPDGCYFFLGDRIENSFDSRFFGPVPQEAIMGKVVKIIRPRRRIGPVR